ncbi:hypothetical protein [Kribbella deserti]|uniref:Uncharacterized protein n=1 Tax=Kribbella deserti TaxID=1926257 RepID=A0ABV6QEV9_9ACTN
MIVRLNGAVSWIATVIAGARGIGWLFDDWMARVLGKCELVSVLLMEGIVCAEQDSGQSELRSSGRLKAFALSAISCASSVVLLVVANAGRINWGGSMIATEAFLVAFVGLSGSLLVAAVRNRSTGIDSMLRLAQALLIATVLALGLSIVGLLEFQLSHATFLLLLLVASLSLATHCSSLRAAKPPPTVQ